ncbi:hypothetical protein PHYBLDRAFT_165023 [Phycomyces blakesleeanus NRRL 1555(-)]|uniref:Uncharacterized protein n=1 Tax=Phycomyces blakesleeanus (strain ATCC 8743b / DSM 1359 / FGSC 10004 / NBRC 33097 / NRRL 1555) TaxID=763407 RepID=A0A162PVX6_PHYB8|nr:hypothetical protein PHYBLDRAFT_165023 [Phycomyces blakesleeanus NRRL 1555(-)]OAD76497.1 hypothetical protein PHYBLDRAFT_165023 [Phycomyces blakesleeanus NRRL 1555(-)]|eukprot:XP_018294537.1 hypothetical protein PHYBLDRAFT_165023 [Phycomyces blakesleeanus NRRL 1555(-)]
MSIITKLSHHKCSICYKCYINKKLVAKCEVQCLEKVYKEMSNTQSSQVASVSEQSNLILNFTSSSTLEESTNMSIDENITPFVINEIDEPMYDIEHEDSMENDLAIMDVTENVIDNTSPQLVYDFSAPVPVPGYDDAKNLKLMKIIREFDISQKAHISLAKQFNEILSRSTGYKTGERSQDAGENLIPASTMIQLPLGRQLAVALKEIGTAMVSSRRSILTSFHGAWINITTRSGYFRAVDWADFILFVIPTLVAEHVHDQAACKALLDLVQTCNLLMSWELSAEEKTLIKTNLVTWNAYLEALLAKGEVQLKVFTINQHLLQHYPAMIEAYGPPRAYSARSVERTIGEYSRAIKTTVTATTLLQYDDPSAGWPIDREGSNVGTDSDIEFWGPLRNRTIVDSFGGISCLPELLQKFYESKGEECSMIEAAIKTSRKAFVNGCVIDSALDHNCVREAHNVRLQVQVDENRNIGQSYSLVYKDFFGKVVVFFEHKLNNKRCLLVLVNVYAVRLVNSIPAINNGQMKLMVVHLADVKELVGLVKSDMTINTITTTATTYVVWSELNRGPKLSLGSLADL